MALRVWLPLNGNLNNQGISTCDPVQTETPTYVDGKIGKALNAGSFYLPASEVAKFYNNNAMSFCFWIYPKEGSVPNPSLIGHNTQGTNGGRMFTIFQYPHAQDLHLHWMSSTTVSENDVNDVWYDAFELNKWNHCAITYDGETALVYINGEYKYSTTGTLSRTNFSYDVPIPDRSTIRYLSDLRIYDHVLSAREIKEISKGLIVHYPLNNQYEQSILNKYSGNNAEGLAISASGFTVTKLENERGYNYKLSTYGNGSSRWYWIEFPSFSFTVGKTYYYSVKIRCHSDNLGMQLRAARCSNDWVTNIVGIQTIIHDWKEYVVHVVMPESFVRRDETVIVESPRLEFCTNDVTIDGKLYEMDFDIKDVQVVESDSYVPYIENELMSNTVCDTSGYKHNAIASGDIMIQSDSPRYNTSSIFNGTNVYITAPVMTLNMSNIAFSFWCKWSEFKSWSRIFDFGTVYPVTSTQSNGILCANYGTKQQLVVHIYYDNLNVLDATNIMSITPNTWYHVVITTTKNVCNLYINGKLYKSFQLSKELGQAQFNYNYLGKSNWTADNLFKGNISDFRIYATVLSAEDVKELYEQSAFIDNKGNIGCYEFVES